ncbi:uncharacterized protein LOC120090225 isoform X3 [Benincasa hispida]|nr:uncharacterized protein LOC120090225 isoform X3 [Benincasa hispida]XP_038903707.1 uncharacterized protein LOC120090225 isoform X3 [Benincasa hispida]XP_038903708.1 uncharacterized protein LOC120090225 isoform X3 [Benincasa hispida]XP_038903709.1 uncharacterized protein LOC120090225 isoform X3 [Benincasa hispida]
MDYDDNDFQSQNLHLAGEGSAKFPPVLRQYALPKFDFDDTLQGHVRFDSLVEPEVFLGIENNEDNQWIEDYSRGSSGIGFTSCAAESCSILRRKNVWSEATSSESVEMLLKSVGQEDINLAPTVTGESNAREKLDYLTNPMDPTLKDDGSSFGEMGDLQPTLLSNISLEELHVVNEDIRGEQQQPQRDDPTEFQEICTVDRSLVEVDPGVAHEIVDMPASEGSSGIDESKQKINTSVAISVEDKGQDDFSAYGKHINDLVTCTQEGSGKLSSQKIEQQIKDLSENPVNTYIGNIEQVVNSHKSSKEDQNHVLSPSVPVDRLVVESSIATLQSDANMTLKGDCVFHSGSEEVMPEVPSKTDKFDDKVLCSNVEIGNPSKENMCEVLPTVVKGDARTEVSAGEGKNINAEVCAFQGPKIDSVGQMACAQEIISEDQQCFPSGTEIQTSKSEFSASAIEESNASKVGESNIGHIRDIPDKFTKDGHGFISSRDVRSCTLPIENLYSEGHLPPTTVAESTQLCEETKLCQSGNVHVEHASCKEEVRLSSDSISVNGKIAESPVKDKRIVSLSFQESGVESGTIDTKLEYSAKAGDESVSVSTFEDANVRTCDTSQGDSLPVVDALTDIKDADDKEDQLQPAVVEFTPSDSKEESGVIIPAEGSFPLLDTSQPMGKFHPLSEAEKSTCVLTGQGFGESIDQTISKNSNSDDCNRESQSIPQADIPSNVIQDCVQEMHIDPAFSKSTAKACDSGVKKSDEKSSPLDAKSLTPLPGETLDSYQKDQENIRVVSESVGNNCQQAIAVNIVDSDAGKKEGSLCSAAFPQSHEQMSVMGNGNSTADKPPPNLPDVVKTAVVAHDPDVKDCNKGPASKNVEAAEAKDRLVGNASSGSELPKGNIASESETALTFESRSLEDLPKNDSGIVVATAASASLVVEGPQSSSGLSKLDIKSAEEISHSSPHVSEAKVARARSKGTPERKPRRAAKGLGKESSTKGSHTKKSEKVEKSNSTTINNPGIFQLAQSNEMQHHGHVESSGAKPFVFIGASTTSIPDLNNSASPSPMFQQPFTDLQQVQLRAQIFVYGALIQGTAPDEAYMLSAFGGPDGGTNLWENAWRTCVDRLNGKKSQPINPETPSQSQSGGRSTEQASKQSTLQSKIISPPVSRVSSKSTSTVLSPMIPLSSPLWSISTPSNALQSSIVPRSPVIDYQQALTPLHPYQTPPVRNFIGHNLSWFSQAPFHSTWVATQTSTPDSSARFSGLPITEPVHLTPVKESSVSQSSAMKPSGSMVHGGTPGNVLTGASPLLELKKVSVTTGQNSTDSKMRRRKKNTVAEEPGLITMQVQPHLKPVPAVVTTTISTLATSPSVHPKGASENLILSPPPLCPTTHPKSAGQDLRGRAMFSEETLGKVREAKQVAEDAALFASEAVKHSAEVWSQLDRQKNSEFVSDVEAKLASAAVAIAAAAAVAKAAAAAANVASNAACQAKLMADEAFTSSSHDVPCQSNEFSVHGSAVGVGKATPASILRGEDGGNGSSSIIFAAREAARKRVEAASAASKHAENVDAIVKAAELAAAAVSQAGKLVAMSDPLPLGKLVEAGPDGYWKTPQVSSELVMRSDDVNGGCSNSAIKRPRDGSSSKNEIQVSVSAKSSIPGEISVGSVENHPKLVDGITSCVAPREKDLRGLKDQNASDLTKTIGVVPESEVGERSSQDECEKAKDLKQSSIKEGSHVEVFKDGNGLKASWFTASVLSLKEGKAYVSYTELQPEEGSGQLKEWVALDGQGGMAPRIRISRPMTTMRTEGTRKRRRAAAGDYIWSVGDKVDAWMQNSWHEGVVVEKNAKDETTYIVRFPAQGETSTIKAWNLRPSLIWKDGEWFEFSGSYVNDYSHEIVVPQEKRMKLGSPTAEVKRKDKMPTIVEDVELAKTADPSLLLISANEKVFNIGRNTQSENKSNPLKTSRTGLQKGASRVIIGVPRPGKKRKFMEVSKHYDADTRTTEANDSTKLAKYLMPHGSTSKGLKRTSKYETKEKTVNDAKPLAVKSGKQPSVSDHAVITKDSESQNESTLGKNDQMDVPSFCSTEEVPEGSVLFPPAHAPKKASSFHTKPERANKGKLAPAVGKLTKIEEEKVFNGNPTKPNSNVIEPRRSNRRIQPTSRLLEGLQSSLAISKIPSISHDKGQRSQNRNASRGNKI